MTKISDAHATAPELNEGLKAINPETITKRTEKEEIFYVLKEKVIVDDHYGTFLKKGTKIKTSDTDVIVKHLKNGLRIAHEFNCVVIPWDKLERKSFITVRESVTTVYEIVEG